LLARAVKFKVTNFGRDPYEVSQGDYIGQIIILGVDEVECDFVQYDDGPQICLGGALCELHGSVNALAAPVVRDYKTPCKEPWSSFQSQGGPDTTCLCDPDAPIPEPCGVLQLFASRILVEILYAACVCRFDLLRAVCELVSCTNTWTHQCDCDLHRLICYINAAKDHGMIGWCGDPSEALELRVYADADFVSSLL
jgi:hypothetical protein